MRQVAPSRITPARRDSPAHTSTATQRFMGAGQMLDRLSAQVGSHDEAVKILIARGHLKADGKTWTEAGAKRNAMTAAERAKDREATRTGLPVSLFHYDPKTNRATRR
jgi:hypothetical protein